MIEKQSNLDDYHTFMQENTELPYYIKFRENGEKVIYGSFWTNKQRGGNSIQEISYRACFKPQLPE